MRRGRLDEAIGQFYEVIRLRPDDVDAHNNLGVALTGAGRFEDAIAQFRAVLKLAPGNMEARQNLVIALRRKSGREMRPPDSQGP